MNAIIQCGKVQFAAATKARGLGKRDQHFKNGSFFAKMTALFKGKAGFVNKLGLVLRNRASYVRAFLAPASPEKQQVD